MIFETIFLVIGASCGIIISLSFMLFLIWLAIKAMLLVIQECRDWKDYAFCRTWTDYCMHDSKLHVALQNWHKSNLRK